MDLLSAEKQSSTNGQFVDSSASDRRSQYAIVAGFSALFIAYFFISRVVPFLSQKSRLFLDNRRTLNIIKTRILEEARNDNYDMNSPVGNEQDSDFFAKQDKYPTNVRKRQLYKLKSRRIAGQDEIEEAPILTRADEHKDTKCLPKFQLRVSNDESRRNVDRDDQSEHLVVEGRGSHNHITNSSLDSATLHTDPPARPTPPSEVPSIIASDSSVDYDLLLQRNPWSSPNIPSGTHLSAILGENTSTAASSNVIANRALRESQDREYAASTAADLQRQHAEDESKLLENRMIELAEERRRYFEGLPEEPMEGEDSVYAFAFNFRIINSDGQAVEDASSFQGRESVVKRRFRVSDRFSVMLDFIENHPLCPVLYTSLEVITSYPKVSLTRSSESSTLAELGFNTHTRLIVQISTD